MTRAGVVAGVVVAGGRSSRMGVDKAGLPWRGTTLLGHVLGVLAAAVDGPLVVVGAADRPHPLDTAGHPGSGSDADLDADPDLHHRLRRAADPVPGRGPLQGIAAGLLAVADSADTAFVASVDLPRLHPAFVRAVLAHRQGADEVALPHLDGHRQPLAAAYATALGARAAALLEAGRGRPGDLFDRSRVVELDAAALLADLALAAVDPALDAVRGVNTPEEFRAAGGDPDPT